jgi:hypothetical protein
MIALCSIETKMETALYRVLGPNIFVHRLMKLFFVHRLLTII